MVDIEITASSPKAQVEVVGTDIKGPVPLKAKLEKDKAYQVRVSAPGMATLEQEVKGGTDKWPAKLIAKPMVITATPSAHQKICASAATIPPKLARATAGSANGKTQHTPHANPARRKSLTSEWRNR